MSVVLCKVQTRTDARTRARTQPCVRLEGWGLY